MSLTHYTTQHIPTAHDTPAVSTSGHEVKLVCNEKTQAAKEYEQSCQMSSPLDMNQVEADFYYGPKEPENRVLISEKASGVGGGSSWNQYVKPNPSNLYISTAGSSLRATKGNPSYNLPGTIGNQIARLVASDYFPWLAVIVAGLIFPR